MKIEEVAIERLSAHPRNSRTHPLGAEVDGDVGDANPVKAIEDALSRRKYDEIILSTLPSGVSRWLGQDLPHKVTRKFKGPVTVVTALRSH